MKKTLNVNGMNIEIDLSHDDMFSKHGINRLKKGYMLKSEDSPQERFAYVASTFGEDQEHAQRMYSYMSKGWWSNSTPVLSFGKNERGLPISCFKVRIDDSAYSLIDSSSETRWMTVGGGGVGIYLGMREPGPKSTGAIFHTKTYDADTLAYKQAETRRGAISANIDGNHPEFVQFLDVRTPTGGDVNQKSMNMHICANLTDDFMRRVERLSSGETLTQAEHDELDAWPLISPEDGVTVTEIASVKHIWQKIINTRLMIGGEPFIHYIDISNRNMPEYQRDAGLEIVQTNLCTEITLATGVDQHGKRRSAVCCLGSINVSKWAEINASPETLNQFMRDILVFLDNVLQKFIDLAKDRPGYEHAVYSAMQERAIGVGMLGWHDYLQSLHIPFESAAALGVSEAIWSDIHRIAMEVNVDLAAEKGPCPDSANYHTPVRFSHVFAIAPNASSAIIMNTSPSTEPRRANIYTEAGDVGVYTVRNIRLVNFLESIGKNTDEVWDSIIDNAGSVQHLEFLSDWDKMVFATAMEIDQNWILEHAALRQPYICQAQSTNLFISPTMPIEQVSQLHLKAWQKDIPTLYYCRSDSATRANVQGKLAVTQKDLESTFKSNDSECVACE